jgi:hypothetical protein
LAFAGAYSGATAVLVDEVKILAERDGYDQLRNLAKAGKFTDAIKDTLKLTASLD